MSNWRTSPFLVMGGSLALVGIVVGLLYAFGVHQQVVELLRWFDRQGAWAAVMFVGIMVLAMIL
ncbi:MAG: TVP38/TMEM64 family protein, partial [Pseudomonadota bacterium]|nr:TVP38/TMEM64 family protein [Pseudomonadota bacterium]